MFICPECGREMFWQYYEPEWSMHGEGAINFLICDTCGYIDDESIRPAWDDDEPIDEEGES